LKNPSADVFQSPCIEIVLPQIYEKNFPIILLYTYSYSAILLERPRNCKQNVKFYKTNILLLIFVPAQRL